VLGQVTCGGISATGSLKVSDDIYRIPWATWTVAPTNLSVTMATGYYHTVGKVVHCSLHVMGKAAADGAIGVYLPVTAASAYQTNGWQPMLWMSSAGAAQDYPAKGSIAPDNAFMYVYPANATTSFTSSVTYDISGEFTYEGV